MVSGLIGNEVPRKGLRVRAPCPPLNPLFGSGFFYFLSFFHEVVGANCGTFL